MIRAYLTALCLASLAVPCLAVDTGTPPTPADKYRAEIVHAINRMSFGIRPGQVDEVEKMGLSAYIQQQLHPEKLDDSAVEAQLKDFRILNMSQTDLHQLYEDQRKVGKMAKNQILGKKSGDGAAMQEGATMQEQSKIEAREMEMNGGQPMEEMTPEKKGRRSAEVEPTELMKYAGNYNNAISELSRAKIIRAVDSPRQLQEVLVDFWGNHFNVDVKKGRCIVYKVTDDREVIRPNVFGNFRDMLEASAKSPAMLFYLDNVQNSAPAPEMPQKMRKSRKGADGEMAEVEPLRKKKATGLNENYAREIMELHTLGVDGGYTQKDVQEVARCFTGWTINRKTGLFEFDALHHDNGPKTVLGHEIPANGGIKDGEIVMDILCAHPATAQHIARQMCQRFVSDDPSPELVKRVAGVFTTTHGNLRAVTEAILTSPEFLDPKNYANKIKSPFEFAVSAVRASGAEYTEEQARPQRARHGGGKNFGESAAILGKGSAADTYAARGAQSMNWHVFLLGQPLFACTPPTGYKETSSAWVNPGALIARLNFAMALTEGRVGDIRFSTKNVIGSADLDDPQSLLDQSVSTLLQNGISDSTKTVLSEVALPEKGGQTVNPNKLVALVIGSPEFQRK